MQRAIPHWLSCSQEITSWVKHDAGLLSVQRTKAQGLTGCTAPFPIGSIGAGMPTVETQVRLHS